MAQFLNSKCFKEICDKTLKELYIDTFWPWTYLVDILCEHWHGKSLLSSPSDAARLTPQIFEAWLHSFSMNSGSTCPLHPTHLNHKAIYHGNNTQGPLLVQRPKWACTQGVNRGMEEKCCPLTMFPDGGSLGHPCHGGLRRWVAARSDNLSWGSNLPL